LAESALEVDTGESIGLHGYLDHEGYLDNDWMDDDEVGDEAGDLEEERLISILR
jgi:hypothetical protein